MYDDTTNTMESMGADDSEAEIGSFGGSYHGVPSLHGRVLKLESTTKKLQTMQYANLGATAICIGGLFMGARVVAKLIKATNQIVQALDQAATQVQPPTMPGSPPRRRDDIGAMRDDIGSQSAYEASTTGYDPGPQDVPPEVRASLERDTNLDGLYSNDDI